MPFVFSVKDGYRQAVEAATGGRNTVLYDDRGNPSVMVVIPKFKYIDLDGGWANEVHPAFIVNGAEKDEIFISKYQNIVYDSRAYSIPAQDPRVSIDYDDALAACVAKNGGAVGGWHLMTNIEWAAIAEWCRANGFQPRGNNDDGRDHDSTHETGVPSDAEPNRTLTGSGPASWNHDGTYAGIADLNGNIREWVHGLKIVNGVAHVQQDNNFNDPEANWVDTETNIVDTQTSGDHILTLREGAITNASPGMIWESQAISATSDGTGSADYGNDGYWLNAADTRFPYRGGRWANGLQAGVFALYLPNERVIVHTYIGFRAAYVSL